MISVVRKKKFSRLRRLLTCSRSKKNPPRSSCEVYSPIESQNKAQNRDATTGPISPAKTAKESAPSTPLTLPETSTPQTSGRIEDSTFVITYNNRNPSPIDSTHENNNKNENLSALPYVQIESFDQYEDVLSSGSGKNQGTVTAFEIDQREQTISTEDGVVSIPQDYSIDIDHVNRKLFQKLEESQKDVLAAIVHPEKMGHSTNEHKEKTFAELPDHPTLGSLEKYRSGLVAGSSERMNTIDEAPDNNEAGGSDRSMAKGSVSEGLRSLWDETTKNLESMNKVFSSCAPDWKQEARESLGEFTSYGEKRKKFPMKGTWLTVPDNHGEDISLLSYPRDMGSITSRWTESQQDDVPVLRKETTVIVEEDEPVQENSKSRYVRWL